MTDRTSFKAGELLIVTTGSYSDYTIRGLVRVEKDFELSEYPKVLVTWANPDYTLLDFPAAIRAGVITDLDFTEVWTDYWL